MVLGIEEEFDGVTDVSSDVGRAVRQSAIWADLDRVSCGGSSGGRGRSWVARFRCGSIHNTTGRNSDGESLSQSNILSKGKRGERQCEGSRKYFVHRYEGE